MKRIILVASGMFLISSFMSCADQNAHYIDLESGKHITVVKDSTKGVMVNKETNEPVGIYVDTDTKDTIYGKTGEVINNHVIKTEDGKYTYEVHANPDNSNIQESEDYKKKVEKDGDVKIKEGDTKIKIDAENGEKKVKKD
jgi:hypothetical protein